MNENVSIYNNEYKCMDDIDTGYINEFDKRVCDFLQRFHVRNYIIPAFISEEILRKSGYFKNSQHQLCEIAVAEPSRYHEVIQEETISKENARMSKMYLTPAVCLHVYPMFQNKKIDENICISTLGKAFRYECGEHDGIQHLWEYHVRECIFIGNKEYVIDSLKQVEDWIYQYAKSIYSDIEIKSASDSFYESSRSKILQKIQLVNNLKQELVMKIDGREIALGSFNFHGTHFSKTYNFDDNGNIVTGCFGFGLERWLYLFKNIKEKK
ncbi:MAG: hypothetical protein GX271_05655 [Clostridiales bacterium]|nr:hypothetical protein [Clostridiales bacterium]